jgi:hypothetical protein
VQFESIGTIVILACEALQSVHDRVAPVVHSLARLAQAEVVGDTQLQVLHYAYADADVPVDSQIFAAEGAKFSAVMNDFVKTITELGENKRLTDLRVKEGE